MGTGAAATMLKPTVNIGTIEGGIKFNMIPSTCVFEADVLVPLGMLTKQVPTAIDSILEAFPNASYESQCAASNPAAYSSHTHEMVGLMQANANGSTPLPICSLGATDCKHLRYQGVPAYTIGPDLTA